MGRKKKWDIQCESRKYKLTAADEKIIRRYVLLLSDTAEPDYLVRVMAYVFRTDIERVCDIIASTSDTELCRISMLREKWKKRAESRLGYIKKDWREDECAHRQGSG